MSPTGNDTTERPLRLGPRQRLRRKREFQRVFDRGCVASGPYLVVHACRNDLPWARIGISVSRRLGGAVVRNRLRRRVREAFRLRQHDLPGGIDIVCLVKPNPDPSLDDYLDLLPRLVRAAVARLDRRRQRRSRSDDQR